MKKLLIIMMIFLITGCVEFKVDDELDNQECLYIARSTEDHVILSDNCYVDRQLYCLLDGEKIQVSEYEYICEVQYGE